MSLNAVHVDGFASSVEIKIRNGAVKLFYLDEVGAGIRAFQWVLRFNISVVSHR